MACSLRPIIRALVAPAHRLACTSALWRGLLSELERRGQGRRESGAFLLGTIRGDRRRIVEFACYDDLDGRCLDSGIVVFDGTWFGPLWERCRTRGLSVVADVHTHRDAPVQSELDRTNPMIARAGHVAIIVANFARHRARASELGLYRYLGEHRWDDWSFERARQRFYIGRWG